MRSNNKLYWYIFFLSIFVILFNASYNSKEPFFGGKGGKNNPFKKAIKSVKKTVKKVSKSVDRVSKSVGRGISKGIKKSIKFADKIVKKSVKIINLDNDGPAFKLKTHHKCSLKKQISTMRHNNNHIHYSNNQIIKKYCEVE